MRKVLLYTLLSLGLGACGGKKTTTLEQAVISDSAMLEKVVDLSPLEAGEFFLKDQTPFGAEVNLKGVHIEEPDTFIFKPSEAKMIIHNNVLLMKDYNAPFYAFTYPDFKYIKTIGRKGSGPHEFLHQNISASADQEALAYLLEGSNGNVYKLGADLNSTYLYNIYAGVKKAWGVDDFTHIASDEYLYVYDSKPGKGIFHVKMEGDSASTTEIFNLTLNEKQKSPHAYTGSLGVNTKQNRMVYAYKYFKIIKFMDMTGNTVRTLNYQQKSFEDGSLKMLDGLDSNVTQYMQVIPTTDYVYITYSGRTPYEVHAQNSKGNRFMHVEKYDWNGNPISIYKLSDFSVYTTIDPKTNQMVLIAYYYDDPFVFYQL